MAYTEQIWDTTSYVNPTRMNHIEDGIKTANDEVDKLDLVVTGHTISSTVLPNNETKEIATINCTKRGFKNIYGWVNFREITSFANNGVVELSIEVDGTRVYEQQTESTNASRKIFSISGLYNVNANSVIKIKVFQNTGASCNYTASLFY